MSLEKDPLDGAETDGEKLRLIAQIVQNTYSNVTGLVTTVANVQMEQKSFGRWLANQEGDIRDLRTKYTHLEDRVDALSIVKQGESLDSEEKEVAFLWRIVLRFVKFFLEHWAHFITGGIAVTSAWIAHRGGKS